jgi:predicted membrane channel-forming protein YqfA (hemolysin III family)
VTISKTGQASWPARCAYLSSAVFIAASGTTNIITYGFAKGDSLATSCVWAGVAGAVAIVLALSWPALIRSLDAKRWSAAVISLVALVLSGTYSVTAALGSAAGGRPNAAAAETAATDTGGKGASRL